MTHLTEPDLVNFGRNALGERKQARIIEHCKECPECADRLIEATREYAPAPGPIKLSRWNKISLVAMVVALIATVLGMFWFFRQLGDVGRIPPNMEAPE
jgi:hypothetical protein